MCQVQWKVQQEKTVMLLVWMCQHHWAYISQREMKASSKNAFITFSSRPQLQLLEGSLADRLDQLERADWGMNTDLQATFKLILDQAVKTQCFRIRDANQSSYPFGYGV